MVVYWSCSDPLPTNNIIMLGELKCQRCENGWWLQKRFNAVLRTSGEGAVTIKSWSKALLTPSKTGRVCLLILEVQDEIYAFIIKIRVVI